MNILEFFGKGDGVKEWKIIRPDKKEKGDEKGHSQKAMNRSFRSDEHDQPTNKTKNADDRNPEGFIVRAPTPFITANPVCTAKGSGKTGRIKYAPKKKLPEGFRRGADHNIKGFAATQKWVNHLDLIGKNKRNQPDTDKQQGRDGPEHGLFKPLLPGPVRFKANQGKKHEGREQGKTVCYVRVGHKHDGKTNCKEKACFAIFQQAPKGTNRNWKKQDCKQLFVDPEILISINGMAP